MSYRLMKASILFLLLTVAANMLSIPVFAADGGKETFQTKLCPTCHGEAGKALYPNYPNLAGHDRDYIIRQFTDIRSGARKNGVTILMRSFPTLKTVDAEQIGAVADYLSQLE